MKHCFKCAGYCKGCNCKTLGEPLKLGQLQNTAKNCKFYSQKYDEVGTREYMKIIDGNIYENILEVFTFVRFLGLKFKKVLYKEVIETL